LFRLPRQDTVILCVESGLTCGVDAWKLALRTSPPNFSWGSLTVLSPNYHFLYKLGYHTFKRIARKVSTQMSSLGLGIQMLDTV
ncbi:hypothetical protein J4G07_08060, partial [Candidatus Poribacteria bacterium]|nr:hypothetical protein [Candidatus Poribacteria bacterium]